MRVVEMRTKDSPGFFSENSSPTKGLYPGAQNARGNHSLAKLMKDFPHAMCLIDHSGAVASVNAAAGSLFDCSGDDLVDNHYTCLFRDIDAKAASQQIALARQGVTLTVWYELEENGRGAVHISLTAMPYFEGDDISGVILVMEDISSALTDSRALKESQLRYYDMFWRNPDIAFHIDTEYRIMDVNAIGRKAFCFDSGEIVGRSFLDFVEPGSLAAFQQHYQNCLAGISASFYSTCVDSNGQHINTDIVLCPRRLGGRVVGVDGIAKDITRQLRAEKKLSEDQQFYSHVLENIPQGVARTDAAGVVVFANSSLENLLDTTKASIIGLRVNELLARHCHMITHDVLATAKNTLEKRTIEIPLYNKSAQKRLSIDVIPDYKSGQEFYGLTLLVTSTNN